VVSGAGKIEKTILDGRFEDVRRQTELTKMHATDIKEQNDCMKAQLSEFKKTLGPLLGMMGTIRGHLQDIQSAYTSGISNISAMKTYQGELTELSDGIQADIQKKRMKLEGF
jgi:hypothetical protein